MEKTKKMMTGLLAEHGSQVKNVQENWNGNTGEYSCSFNGINVSGTIQVNESDVVVKARLPFFVLPFSGMLEKAVRENVEKALR